MVLHPGTIQPARGAKRISKRVGRGNASGRGTYSGRGGKGQTARSGGKSRTIIRGFRSALLKVPKLRGFKSLYPRAEVVNLDVLEKIAKDGEIITPAFLKAKGAVKDISTGVKVLGKGVLDKKINIQGCMASKKAAELIKKAGGTIQ